MDGLCRIIPTHSLGTSKTIGMRLRTSSFAPHAPPIQVPSQDKRTCVAASANHGVFHRPEQRHDLVWELMQAPLSWGDMFTGSTTTGALVQQNAQQNLGQPCLRGWLNDLTPGKTLVHFGGSVNPYSRLQEAGREKAISQTGSNCTKQQ